MTRADVWLLAKFLLVAISEIVKVVVTIIAVHGEGALVAPLVRSIHKTKTNPYHVQVVDE